MKRKERFVIVIPHKVFGIDSICEKYYQRFGQQGPITTTNLKLARKWDDKHQAMLFCQALIKADGLQYSYVGNA